MSNHVFVQFSSLAKKKDEQHNKKLKPSDPIHESLHTIHV